MSRATVVWAFLSFLVVGFALQLLDVWLHPAPLGVGPAIGAAIMALILYLICLAFSLILWAFARFRLEHALIPVIVLGGLTVLTNGTAIAVYKLPSLMGALFDQPAVKAKFRDSYVAGARKSCVQSATARAQGRLSDAEIAAYCDCFAQRSVDRLSGADITALVLDRNNPPPELRSRLVAVARSCVADILQQH
jgi:hypothetical protein